MAVTLHERMAAPFIEVLPDVARLIFPFHATSQGRHVPPTRTYDLPARPRPHPAFGRRCAERGKSSAWSHCEIR